MKLFVKKLKISNGNDLNDAEFLGCGGQLYKGQWEGWQNQQ